MAFPRHSPSKFPSEGAQYCLAGFNLVPEALPAPGQKVVIRNFPGILEVAVQDQLVGPVTTEKQFRKNIIGDDGQLIMGAFRAWEGHHCSMAGTMRKARVEDLPDQTRVMGSNLHSRSRTAKAQSRSPCLKWWKSVQADWDRRDPYNGAKRISAI